MKNKINIPNHCKNVNYCTLVKVQLKFGNFCFVCNEEKTKTIFNKEYIHQLCKEHMFEELTKHNYKKEIE